MNIIIFGLTSDIGAYIAQKYSEQGFNIFGTYRSKDHKNQVKKLLPSSQLVFCDASSTSSIDNATADILNLCNKWDIFISCPCTPEPIKEFHNSDIDQWERSFYINSLSQLRFLRNIHNSRNINRINSNPLVLFFAGGGTNNAVNSFSAYTSAKIHLIKMIELMAFEDQETKYSIIGPGWTNTKTHLDTLKYADPASEKYKEVVSFIQNPINATPLSDIFECIRWIDEQSIATVSGRNFSVVNDKWKGPDSHELVSELNRDSNMYKLRRHRNNWQ